MEVIRTRPDLAYEAIRILEQREEWHFIPISHVDFRHLGHLNSMDLTDVIEDRPELRQQAANSLLKRGHVNTVIKHYSDLMWILKYVPSRKKEAFDLVLENPSRDDLKLSANYCPEYIDLIEGAMSKGNW
jgi:hypothetical protein